MENLVKIVAVAGGSVLGYLFGGWTALLGVLAVFVVVDYATGWMAAAVEGKLKSKIGYTGIARKVGIGLVVSLAHFIDITLGTADMVRDGVIMFYLVNEVLSIIENLGRIGVPIPSVLRDAVEVLKKKGEKKNG